MGHRTGPATARPIDRARLDELALAYVGRFATSRAKLVAYLRRKLRERGWAGEGEPPVGVIADRLVRLGYVDDEVFALAKARSLLDRGYGARRVGEQLRGAGIGEAEGAAALELAGERAAEAALRFARRRRIGPWAVQPPGPKEREKAIAAMIRAGHRLALAAAIVDAPAGEDLTAESLADIR